MKSTLRLATRRSAAVAAMLLATAASAQTGTPAPSTTGPVTDTAPTAAEERGSAGAVVLDKSMVPAQREKARQDAARDDARAREGRPVGRDATRILGNQKSQREREARLRRADGGETPD